MRCLTGAAKRGSEATAWLATLTASVLLTSGTLLAQPGQRVPGLGPDLAPAEIQRLFDAFVLVQAQEALELSEDQFAQFVSRLKRLQESRRTNQREEQRLLRVVQRLATRPDVTDTQIETRLQELEDHRLHAAAAERAAYAEIDDVLEVRQRVRFRFFEQRMERRKLELVMRAGRARPSQPPQRRQRPDPPR